MVFQFCAPTKVEPPVVSSPLDKSAYRALTLSNELRVLIASDFTSDKAAASMNVAVGNFSDPDNLPGLAHFTEHMLFLGTEKFPEEGSYNTFLAENGGYSNAFTASEDTNFHFEMVVSDRNPDLPAPRFLEALDRFSQFFIAPLFTESATDRELNAVHSEHQKNLQNDGRRIHQLVKSVAVNKSHPAHKFSTGSKTTLHDIPREKGIDTRAELLAFHREFYSSNLMTLCIVAPYPLDLLQSWIERLFSAIPNKSRVHPSATYTDIPVLLEENKGLVFNVHPVKDIRRLEISWYTPSFRPHCDEKPTVFISELIGDEAEGSLLSLLKKRGWCNALSAGHYDQATFGTFQVVCELTVDGVDHIDDVIALVYKYISLIRESGVTQQRFDELSTLSANDFRFRERQEPLQFVTGITTRMLHYPAVDYLAGPDLFRKFSPKLIEDALFDLTPENSTVIISGKFVDESKAVERETWYQSPYYVEKADSERLAKWKNTTPELGLFLPEVNPFIPTELDVLGEQLTEDEKDVEFPRLIESNEYFDLHHQLDRKFNRPLATILINLYTPLAYQSPLHSVLGALYVMLLDDVLMEFSYPAHKAGFNYNVRHNHKGISIHVAGYSHRIDMLLFAIVEKMSTLKTNSTRFDMQRDSLERMYRNFDKAQPVSRAMYLVEHLLEERKWHVDEYIKAIESGAVSLERMEIYRKELLSEMKMVAMVIGNIPEDTAISMMSTVKSTLGFAPLPSSQLPSMRVVRLPVEREVFTREENPNQDDNNSAIMALFQRGPRGNLNDDVKLDLLGEIINKPTFHELRTVQQLGYMVFAGVNETEGVRGLFIAVQSTVADPDELLNRIDKLLVKIRKETLEDMSEETLADYISAMRGTKGEPDRTLGHRARRFWSEIRNDCFMFDRDQRKIEQLNHITKEDLLQMYDELVAVGGVERRLVVGQVFGKDHSFENRRQLEGQATEVTDAAAFRRASELYREARGKAI